MSFKISSTVISISGLVIGLMVSVIGIWLWIKSGYPTNELIPYKNTFATNPIHLSYIGVVIIVGSIIHGVCLCGWLNSKQ